ncbi:MAG TPA: glycosyltransferase family 1 protein [Mycobacteriales bacterium]|nr:glycosyltransferase family 1 protein [Mycobacteriales bacterium]
MSRAAAGRVVIDGTALVDGSQFRGIGTYLRELVAGLAAYDDIEPVLMGRRPIGPARWRGRTGDWLLPRDIRRSRPDIFHSPAQSPPRQVPVPWVQTLHDLTPLVFRHPLLEADRRRWERIGPRLRQATRVICVSASSARQAQQLLGVDPDRTTVVPLGVDPAFTPEGPRRTDGPYLLWVSSWGPHKGLEIAASVVAALAAEGRPHQLLVAGYQDTQMLKHVRAAVELAGDRVEVLGHVSELAPLYRGADALLVTSRAEGFGLPALEAMACGCPVIAFANTSLPEVIGDAGLLIADGDVGGYVAGVQQLLDDSTLREQLRDSGIRRAKEFTWRRTVERHVEVYRSLLASPLC